MRLSAGERSFRVLNYTFLALLSFITLYPFWHITVMSFNDPQIARTVYFWPKAFYWANYWLVFTTQGIVQAYTITVLRVMAAVPLMLLVTAAAAFALTRKELSGRKLIIIFFFVTMFFSGGLIPTYMLYRSLHLLNTFWVYVIPSMFSVWTMIVMKTSFQSLPDGLVEAALIDGASYMQIFFKMVIPLSKPMLATLGLFAAVSHWNDWFAGAFFVSDPNLQPLQTFLQIQVLRGAAGYMAADIVRLAGNVTEDPRMVLELVKMTPKSLESAYIMVTTIPILLAYPWLQKYFVKGVLIGSIKE